MKNVFFILSLIVALNAATPCQTAAVPIAAMNSSSLLGGVQNGKWIAPGAIAPKMQNTTEFVIVGLNGVEEGGVTIGKKVKMEEFSTGQAMEFDLTMDHGVAVGSEAKWNLAPRLAKTIDLNNETYKAAVSSFLKKKGIASPIVRIVQALRIDLEGDGTDEVLLSATYYKRGPLSLGAQVGDYSFVLLQKVAGKRIDQYLLEGNFIAKESDSRVSSYNQISAIADLNGDGKMEIVVDSFFAYGDSASAIEMKDGKPIKIKEFELVLNNLAT